MSNLLSISRNLFPGLALLSQQAPSQHRESNSQQLTERQERLRQVLADALSQAEASGKLPVPAQMAHGLIHTVCSSLSDADFDSLAEQLRARIDWVLNGDMGSNQDGAE